PAETQIDLGAYRIADPEAFGRNFLRLMEEGTRAMYGLLERAQRTAGPFSVANEWSEAGKLFSAVIQPWLADPLKRVEAQGARVPSYMQLMANTAQRAAGGKAAPVAEPEPGDNRFNDPEWSRNPYFDFWKQAYLITCRWLQDMLDKTEGLDERT